MAGMRVWNKTWILKYKLIKYLENSYTPITPLNLTLSDLRTNIIDLEL